MFAIVYLIAVVLFGIVGTRLLSKLFPTEQFLRVICQLIWWVLLVVTPFTL
ncbi:hypothetical protein 20Sep420_00039 [Pseudomonas phage 20Sep420]|nr:hypothetical protein 20Sep420_00039 [Pseudomonas phage 20Sep420]